MKLVKGVSIFLVLCLAAYGAFTLLQNQKSVDLNKDDIAILSGMGIGVSNDGHASESGLSSMFDVEGADPIGATHNASSSTPPGFLGGEPTTSSLAPSYGETALPVAMSSHELQPAPPMDVLPPPPAAPVGFPYQAPSFETAPSPPVEAPPFGTTPPVPTMESPPPWERSWDGPTSGIPVPPPQEVLQSIRSPLPTTPSIPQDSHPLSSGETIAYSPIESNVRRIGSDSANQHTATSSASASVPAPTPARYAPTSARHPLAFEPVKPETSQNAPVLAFAQPKRINTVQQQATMPQPQPSQENHQATKPIDNPSPTQPTVQEAVERFIQLQRQLAESGEPEKIRLAFVQLSQLYEHDQLSDVDRIVMQPILDRLALTVIYARDTHILESPYRVRPGDTVESIAQEFTLPPVLLRKINGLAMTAHGLPVGGTLKVVCGQFDARISVKRKELTLLLGGLYAGRFPITMPNARVPVQSGEFFVSHKTDRLITLSNGWTLAAAQARDATILLADQDAREIFDILSEQSVIVLD